MSRTHFEQYLQPVQLVKEPLSVMPKTRLSTLLERSVLVEKAITNFADGVTTSRTGGYSRPQVKNFLTDIVDVVKRYPHRYAKYDDFSRDQANHIPWSSLIDALRGSWLRADTNDLPLSGRTWSIGSGWFSSYLRKLMTNSGLFEIYIDPRNSRTERVRLIHFLPTEPASQALQGKRVRIMPARPDLTPNESSDRKQAMVGRTGTAHPASDNMLHGDDAYLVDLDPISTEEIANPTIWIVIGDELEPLPGQTEQ